MKDRRGVERGIELEFDTVSVEGTGFLGNKGRVNVCLLVPIAFSTSRGWLIDWDWVEFLITFDTGSRVLSNVDLCALPLSPFSSS